MIYNDIPPKFFSARQGRPRPGWQPSGRDRLLPATGGAQRRGVVAPPGRWQLRHGCLSRGSFKGLVLVADSKGESDEGIC